MDEEALAKALEGKFFWEPTTLSMNPDCEDVVAIRKAQMEFSKGAKRIVTARNITLESVKVECIKVRTVALRGESKILEPIVNAVSTAYDVAFDDVLGKSTSPKHKMAKRHLYWLLFRYMPNLSSAEFGRLLGKCHTTILHGKKTYEENPDPEKTAEIDKIMCYKCGS